MKYKSGAVPKLEYGQYIAASLAYLILNQRDSVGLATFDNEIRGFLPPSQHASHLKLLLHELSKVEPREKSGIGGIFHPLAARSLPKGREIVISHPLDEGPA